MSYEKFTKNNPIKNELVEILKENCPHLFEDNQINFDKLLKELNFDNSKNIIIEGDNLEVLKILKNSYFNQVDVIYIDPPYNTGNDFVYNDSFKQNIDEYKINQGLVDENGFKTTTNQKTDGRFHTNWLNMIYPRLIIAKQLLKKDGVIFISIDDNEQARLKLLCDEIFGESNFISTIIWQKTTGANDSLYLKETCEYILVYSKSKSLFNINEKLKDILNDKSFKYKDDFFNERGFYKLVNLDNASHTYSKNLDYEIIINEKSYYPGKSKENWIKRQNGVHAIKDWQWMWSKEKLNWGLENNFIVVDSGTIKNKVYQFVDNSNQKIERSEKFKNLILVNEISNLQGTNEVRNLFDNMKIFDHPKPISLIKYLVNLHTNKNALILDFFAGSGSTGHAVMDLNKEDDGNRKFILVQLDEKIENNDEFKLISDITRERINRAINKYEYQNQGYKFFKCKSSNIINWNSQNNNEQLSLESINFEEILKEDRSYLDLVYEIGLTMGMKLDSQIEQFDFYFYNKENNMIFLFSDKNKNGFYQIDEIHKIIKNYYELNSDNLQIYLLDCKFKNDEDKLNCLTQIEDISDQIKIVVV